ncbi:MAG: DUF4835 family protein [Bacteroidales bacterium]|nr:DUF4835 family protein [Bacteroidales bacterium]HOI32900.1 DUF4835 family protein [Bacteroidales bacterium]
MLNTFLRFFRTKSLLVILIVLLFGLRNLKAQEFLADIRVTAPTIEGTDRRVFESLQQALYDFINNRKWTNVNLKNQERIEFSILITVKERVSSDEFKGSINLVLRRPVFKSSYNSVLFNYVDESFQFRYIESQPLDYIENSYSSSLTSTIAFYLYYLLGLDFDSFSLYGGDPFFRVAESIVNAAQNASERGWKAFDGNRNRYWLVENMTNPAYRPLRQFMYEYHRLGFDIMSEKPDEGRVKIGETLKYLEQTWRDRPNLLMLQLFLDAKRDEIINVFSQGSPQEKTKAVNIMREIDPANASKYEKILAPK